MFHIFQRNQPNFIKNTHTIAHNNKVIPCTKRPYLPNCKVIWCLLQRLSWKVNQTNKQRNNNKKKMPEKNLNSEPMKNRLTHWVSSLSPVTETEFSVKVESFTDDWHIKYNIEFKKLHYKYILSHFKIVSWMYYVFLSKKI